MNRILKYQMQERIGQIGKVEMPLLARIKHVEIQYGKVTFWVETSSDTRIVEDRIFRVLMTGDEIPENWSYINTFIIRNGIGSGADFVGHVYEDCTKAQEFEDELLSIAEESA